MRIVEIPILLDIAQLTTYYDQLKVYKSTTENGTYSSVGAISLAGDNSLYAFVDNDGLETDWYKFTYYKSSAPTAESSQLPVPFLYASVSELKNNVGETGDDLAYTRAMVAATDEVRRFCNRNFEQKTTTRYFEGTTSNGRYSGQDPKKLFIDDCVSLSAIVLDFSNGRTPSNTSTYTLNTQVYLWPQDAPQKDWPYQALAYVPGATLPSVAGYNENYASLYWPKGYQAIRLTGVWGWPLNSLTQSVVPPAVKEATLQIAARMYRGRATAYSRELGNADMGVIRIREQLMNKDVLAMLTPYRKEVNY